MKMLPVAVEDELQVIFKTTQFRTPRDQVQNITKESREMKETEENIKVMESGRIEMLSGAVQDDKK
jgi:hypothetical protein